MNTTKTTVSEMNPTTTPLGCRGLTDNQGAEIAKMLVNANKALSLGDTLSDHSYGNYERITVGIIAGIFKVMHIIGVKCEYGVRGKTRVLILNGKEYKL